MPMPKPLSLTEARKKLGIRNTSDPDRKPASIPKSRGQRMGMGIYSFWATLFATNERLPKFRRMTDTEIKRQVMKEYPNRSSVQRLADGRDTVNYYRNLYNAGKLTGGIVPPIPSRRYSNKGLVLNGRSGRPLDPQPED